MRLGAKNIEDIPEARVKQVLADTKHENLQGLLADVGLGNAMSVMVARRMLGDELPPEQPKSTSKKMPIKGPTACWSPSPTAAAPSRGCHHRPHQPGQGTGDPPGVLPQHQGYSREPDKYLPVRWEVDKEQEQEFRTGISIEIVNHQGALAELANVIAATGANIHAISTEEKDGRVMWSPCSSPPRAGSTSPTSCARSGHAQRAQGEPTEKLNTGGANPPACFSRDTQGPCPRPPPALLHAPASRHRNRHDSLNASNAFPTCWPSASSI